MPTTEFDYLIIGQGLAGTILAHTLITRGQRVMVIDNAHSGSSSKVAAGIINPITGPRLKQSDDFKHYVEQAKSYYAKLEYHIKKQVFTEIKQVRQIQNDEQLSFLEKRLADPQYSHVIQTLDNKTPLFKKTAYPQITINGTAIVNTRDLLSASKTWLASLQSYQQSEFNYQDLTFHNNGVEYKNIHAKEIIFCEGYQATNNPWLKELPFKLAKGEIITLENEPSNNTMLSWDKWLVPLGKSAKLGSNFAWDDLSLTPSNATKDMLLTSAEANIDTNITAKVLRHEVGIRPSTRQREPFVGALSTQNNAYCFNGFGSKGCLLIPHYATLLADHLQHQTTLPSKVTQWL